MKKNIFPISLILCASVSFSQDTFSICAVDTITGEVGSAGASCIDDIGCGGCGGVVIISDVHPGKGVIHTQAQWNAGNQNNAKLQMNTGMTPQQIISWLQSNDVQGNSSIRQYGMVDFDSNGTARSAAFTGTNCMNYKNHITGPNYSIQGNILLGQQILDSMEVRFLNEPGDLACKLMAALQGAKVIGADTRCTTSGNSSLSSFIRVAKPGDVAPNYFLNLVIKYGPAGFEPIDSLQTMFNAVHSCVTGISENQHHCISVNLIPNPANDNLKVVLTGISEGKFSLEVYNMLGRKEFSKEIVNESSVNISSLKNGMYFYKINLKNGKIATGKFQKN